MYKARDAMKILSRISIKRIEISMNTLLIVHGGKDCWLFLRIYERASVTRSFIRARD